MTAAGSRARIAAPLLVLVLAIARLAYGDPFAVPEAQEVAGPSERAREILGALGSGSSMGGLEVQRAAESAEGEVEIELASSRCGLRAWVVTRGAREGTAPVQGERFDFYYGPPSPGAAACSSEETLAALTAIRDRIDPLREP